MKRRFEWRLVVALLLVWLLLNDSLDAKQVALGLGLALTTTLLTGRMRPVRAHARRPWTMVMLIWHVLLDIIASNIAVTGVILGPSKRRQSAGFIRIPLELRSPHGLAVLACIITATPGTVWAGLSADGSCLSLHVLELKDEAALIQLVQQRYERPLMEIFE